MKTRYRGPRVFSFAVAALLFFMAGPMQPASASGVLDLDALLPEPLHAAVREISAFASPIHRLDERMAVDLSAGALIWISPDAADPLSAPGLVAGRVYRSRSNTNEGLGRDWRFQLLIPADPQNGRGYIVRSNGRPVAVQSDGRRLAELIWENARLVEIRREGGGARRLVYTAEGALAEETGDGPHARYTYDKKGRLTDIEWNRRSYSIRYDEGDRVTVISIPGGNTVHFEYVVKDGARIVRAQSAVGVRLTWIFEPRLTTVRSGEREALVEFDAAGRAIRLVDFDGREALCERDAQGRPLRVRNAEGAEWTVRRDTAGRPLEWTLPAGGRERVRYDAEGRPLEFTDALGRITSFAADEFGVRLRSGAVGETRATRAADGIVSIEGAGEGWRFERGALFERFHDPLGRVFEYRFNPAGQLVEMVETGGARHRFEYDRPGGLLSGYTGPDGIATRFETDPASFEWTAVRRADGDIKFEYDRHGRRIRERDGRVRLETEYRYDPQGRLTEVKMSDGGRAQFEWDEADRLRATESLIEGRTMIVRFDTAGRLVEESVRGGDQTRYRWDAAGRLVEEISSAFGRIVYEWDAADRLRSATGASTKATWSFDEADRLVRAETPDASLTISYGETGYEMKDAGGQWRRFEADAMGRIVATEDAAGVRQRYALDGADRVTRIEGPGDRVETLEYTPDGLLLNWKANNATVLAFEYDVLRRPIAARGLYGDLTWVYAADGGGVVERNGTIGRELVRRLDSAARLVEMQTAGAPPIHMAYDAAGRLRETAAARHRVQFIYDEFGRRVEQRYSSGLHQRYFYDAAGRLTGVELADRNGRAIYRAVWTHDAEGRVATADFNGRAFRLAYSAGGAVISFAPARGRAETYAYDAAGSPARIGERRLSSGPMHRVSQAGDRRYAWDALGAVSGMADREGEWRFAYDAAGRLAAAARSGRVIRFRYDALGRLAARETDADSIQFQYDDDRLLAVWRKDHVALFLPGGDGHPAAAILDGDRLLCPVFDPNGSLLAIANEAGTLEWEVVYRPFGDREIARSDYTPPIDFHGQYRDPNLDILCFGARWYDPRAGRFLQPDPDPGDGSDPLSFNAYLLARNDPVNFTDPNGLKPKKFLSQQRIEQIKAQNAQTVNQTLGRTISMKHRIDNGLKNLNPPAGGNTQSDFLHGLSKQGPQGGWKGAGPKGSTADAMANHYGGGAPPPARGFDTRQAAQASQNIKSQLAARGPKPVPTAPTAPQAPSLGSQMAKWGGRGLIIYGIINSANNIYQAPDKVGAAVNEAGRWGGAYAGAKTGAVLGAPFGPVGAGVGGVLGGILGGMLGDALTSPDNRPESLPPITPTNPAAIQKGLADIKRSGMPFDPGTPGIAGGTADIGAPGGLRGAEPGAGGGAGGGPLTGGFGVAPGVLDSFSNQRGDARSQTVAAAGGLMTAQTQMTQAAGAGDQQARDAQRTRDAGGQEARTITDNAARDAAQKQRDQSWGKEIGDAVTSGIQKGGEAFGEALGTAAAQKAAGAIFGSSRRNKPSSPPAADTEEEDGEKPAVSGAPGAGKSATPPSGGKPPPKRRPPKSDADGDENPPEDGETEPPPSTAGGGIGVVNTTQNPDGTVTVTYGCGHSWTGKPPAPPQCPICGSNTSSTQTSTTPPVATPPATPPPPPTTPSPPPPPKKKRTVVRCPICKSSNVDGPRESWYGPYYKCGGCGAAVKSYAMIYEEVDE